MKSLYFQCLLLQFSNTILEMAKIPLCGEQVGWGWYFEGLLYSWRGYFSIK